MKTYKVKVSYTFEGEVKVRAENKNDAKEIVERDFGLVSPEVSTSNTSDSKDDEGVVDWNIDVHPNRIKIK